MVQVGIFFNGGTSRPLKRTDEGHLVVDASVAEIHEENKTVDRHALRQATLGEELGFTHFTCTEHHFQLGGAEHSPNPLLLQTYIAAKTDEIRLRQIANIIVWHDPIRIAEQAAMLDNLSEGRVEFGIGRGYQPRENEMFGQYWGGTIQDEEKNRTSFAEKFDIIRKAWTEELFSHNGQFHHVPPAYTKWHHKQDYTYLADEVSGHDVDDVMDWDYDAEERTKGYYSQGDGDSTLSQVAVFPQPYQQPHPQVWEPVGSPRSIRFAAEHAINAYLTTGPPPVVAKLTETYYDHAEAAGWPDHRPEFDGEPFAFGWDAERARGVCTRRPVFLTDAADEETFEDWKESIEFEWGWYEPFDLYTPQLLEGFTGDDRWSEFESLGYPYELVEEHGIVMVGTAEEVLEKLINLKETVGYEDFHVDIEVGGRGLSDDVAEEQLVAFGEHVLPYLEEEYPSP
jgi:alkanesulfonate monooxygenase SsuD/methylene tetrahydromethanopterin reductase-like flavin-dependent oxidoreductase (luciferase family)